MKSGFWDIDHTGPIDRVVFCPLSFRLENLSNQVYQALRIKDAGGLEPYFKKPVSKLPHITVVFYNTVINVQRRFNTHKETIMARMKEG